MWISEKARRVFRLDLDGSFFKVLTHLAEIATVVTLILILLDRREQTRIQTATANVAAWSLLAKYNHQKYNAGQVFALETLSKNIHNMYNFQYTDIWLVGAQLGGIKLHHATLISGDLRFADMNNAWLVECICENDNFTEANLSGATIGFGEGTRITNANFRGSDFSCADISDVTDGGSTDNVDNNKGVFAKAFWRLGHKPKVNPTFAVVDKPISLEECRRLYGKGQ